MGAGYKSNDLLLLVFLAVSEDAGGEGERGRPARGPVPARSGPGGAGAAGRGG